MVAFIGKRLIQMFFLFILFLSAVFFLLNAQPGDITSQFLDPTIPAANRELISQRLGLDGNLMQQWWNYITNFFTGNLGVSFAHYPQPVMSLIGERLPRTMFLFSFATLLAYLMGFVLGKRIAWNRGTWSEHSITTGGVLLYTVFYPWFAVIMILVFASGLGWFPINGFLSPELWRRVEYTGNDVFNILLLTLIIAVVASFVVAYLARRPDHPRVRAGIKWGGFGIVWLIFGIYWWTHDARTFAADLAHHAILPTITLALVAFAGVMLLTRSSMLETLSEDYILTARAKGLAPMAIRDKHAARNAMLPVTTSFVLGLAFVIGGGIVTETVFGWPGMGQLLLASTRIEDLPVAIGALAFIGVFALVAHLLVDILYMFLDPRIRYQVRN